MQDITQPLRLAVGSQEAGSGFGCAMNVISWENGDQTISDMPDCTHPALAEMVYRLNDYGCDHTEGVVTSTEYWGDGPDGRGYCHDCYLPCEGHTEEVELLCANCSFKVLKAAHTTVGTNFKYRNESRFGMPFKWYTEAYTKVYKAVVPESAQRQRDLNREDPFMTGRQKDGIEKWILAGLKDGLDEGIARFEKYVTEFKKVFAKRIAKAGEVRMKRDLEAALKMMYTRAEALPKVGV